MTKTQVEVITSVQRRRHWSRAEKERIVAAAMEPGAVASEVARACMGFTPANCFRWRRQLCEPAQIPAVFNPVAVTPDLKRPRRRRPEKVGVIEIEFASGGRMRISGAVDASTVSALMKALAKGKRRR